MNMKMNNFDKVKRDALNELNAEQSQQLIKANTLQILNLIFTDEMDENKLNELSKRQIDLVNFYYEKGYHFEMMHGIINGCYEKICDLYSQSVSHTYECMLNDLHHKVAMYCLQSDFLKSAIAIESKEMQQECLKKFTKKQAKEIDDLHYKLKTFIDFIGADEDDVQALFNQFDDARKYVESVKGS